MKQLRRIRDKKAKVVGNRDAHSNGTGVPSACFDVHPNATDQSDSPNYPITHP